MAILFFTFIVKFGKKWNCFAKNKDYIVKEVQKKYESSNTRKRFWKYIPTNI